jgi:uncharacterized cupredoxin-like copper-binding protein
MSSAVVAPSRSRSLRRASRILVLGGLALLIAASSFPVAHSTASTGARTLSNPIGPPGGAGGATGVVNLTVNLTDGPSFDPHNLGASAGDVVHFALSNTGIYTHSFTIWGAPGKVLAHNITPNELDASLSANGTLVNVSLAPGTNLTVNYSIPSSFVAASYEIVSQVAYQFQAGMFGFFNITSGSTGAALQLTESTTDSLSFVPNVLDASNITTFPALIEVQITNLGSDGHTWSLEKQSNNTLDPASYNSYFTSNPPLASVNVVASPGSIVWANFTVTGPGAYEYICEIPGHFANGMDGWLYVGVPPPAVALSPSSALVQPALLAGAGILLGIGILLAIAASFQGRFPKAAAPPKSH